ncbi:MAG: RlmE family RNA methyltransferase [Deltaproteobacteria bacterium]|jgi:23S rRNA (uridine2552-2'-O)-methyltransferase|nr:RlmE family RNA methyltransferase [Deltaproteobacteria bacterium]
MKRTASKKNTRWQDHYTRRAKKERFPARSVYKLQEIQQKHQLIKKGYKVLDLGCAPGSWLLYAAKLTGNNGRVVGIDLKPVTGQVPAQAQIIKADVFTLDVASLGNDFNVVLSDMAPATTGHKDVDAARSYNLCETALSIAQSVLLPGGSFVCKIFQGPDFKAFANVVGAGFKELSILKPRSSRKTSREIFVIGMGKK